VTQEERSMRLMQTLHDAWNAQDWDTFASRHKPDTVVRWPGQPPTYGNGAYRQESIDLFKTFPDNRVEPLLRPRRHDAADWSRRVSGEPDHVVAQDEQR
jgi:hypothetical protein